LNNSTPLLTEQLVIECRRCGSGLKAADTTGAKVSGLDLLLRTIILKRLLQRLVWKSAKDEQNVAILLPPTVPAVITNFALAFAGKTSVNLNYTASEAILNQCIKLADIKHVLTSRKVTEKLGLKLDAELVYLEDFKSQVTIIDKVVGFFSSRFLPVGMLCKQLGIRDRKPTDPLTIVFTSGSTGTPKGVVLSYGNINANVQSLTQALDLRSSDVLVGILPFFHSFGYTVTLWAAQALSMAGVYHFSPLEARPIGKLVADYKATILLATPTFLRSFLRRVDPEQFKSLELVIVGAEKQPQSLSDAFEKQFGVRPVEGYGLTEMSPLVSVNLPSSRTKTTDATKGLCEGSVGRPLPGVEARIVDLDTRLILPRDQTGMLEVRGPSLMQGYLHREDLTAKAIVDGWYITGDVAKIDCNGYIHITGRQSRFSKIAGEMIPHIQIEEVIQGILGADSEGILAAVVTAIPDEKRGERLIVLHTELPMSPSEILKKMSEAGLPNLYLPSKDSFILIDAIPVLGSGKLDLKGMQQMALDKAT